MNEFILHHYPASPYAEKIRLMLGFKGLRWKSVIIPVMMPKPDVIALTGGYRRTPLLQIGADVYCDTARIALELERRAPSPTLNPFGDTFAVQAMSSLAESALFNTAVPIAFQPDNIKIFFPDAKPDFLPSFGADRVAMRKGGTVRRGPLGESKSVFVYLAQKLENQFADGRVFLLGNAPCTADFSVYHTVWPVGRVPALAALLKPMPRLIAWMARMQAIGHGKSTTLSSSQALEISKAAKPAPIKGAQAYETDGAALGDTVEVMPVDYALDPVRGELLNATTDEIAVRRSDPRAGTVVVHFPRMGFQLQKAG
ncbi:MAG: glutathione S-transferase [Betaproteobacteria bacterium SG8_39]|nr:MAG: glutathione S-transferase [Betaproteobacteria bacterium SG8_39]